MSSVSFWRHPTVRFIADLALNLIIIVGLVLFLRIYIISPFRVSGSSMVPTLQHRDFLIVNKLDYRFGEPDRGDVVIVIPPSNPDTFYVKRVIALPGETIAFEDGKVRIKNDSADFILDEPYINPEAINKTFLPGQENQEIVIPDDEYFLMGDNRLHSSDSRIWRVSAGEGAGSVSQDNIVGRAWTVIWPRLEIIHHQDYTPSD